jgi:hypothetical protein
MPNFWDKDKGWKELVHTFEVNDGEMVAFVGFLRSSGMYKNKGRRGGKPPKPITIAQLAAVHEYGSSDGHIPQRSFFISTLTENRRKIEKRLKKLAGQILDGGMNERKGLGAIAEWVKGLIKSKIASNIPPQNADSTVKRKGSSHTLIDTGQMINSVDWEVKKGKGKK